jgi:hypothetical protein
MAPPTGVAEGGSRDCSQVLAAFAAAVSRTAEEVTTALQPLVGPPGPASLSHGRP